MPAGSWKPVDNAIEDEVPDGSRHVHFETAPAAETSDHRLVWADLDLPATRGDQD